MLNFRVEVETIDMSRYNLYTILNYIDMIVIDLIKIKHMQITMNNKATLIQAFGL